MKTFWKSLSYVLLIIGFSWSLIGCQDDTDPLDEYPRYVENPASVPINLTGIAVNEQGEVLPGVTITVAGENITTNAAGKFQFSNLSVPGNRLSVVAKGTGLFPTVQSFVPQANQTHYVQLRLSTAVFDRQMGATGGNLSVSGGASLTFPAAAFATANNQAYSGTALLATEYLDPTADEFATSSQSSEAPKQLFFYGKLRVLIESESGEPLKVANGKKVAVVFPIPTTMRNSAPSSIGLYHFSQTEGRWVKEGNAARVNNEYRAEVSHFSDWAIATETETARIKGQVRDCQQRPLLGIVVRVGQQSVITNQAGAFEVSVPTGSALSVEIKADENFGLQVAPIAVQPLRSGELKEVGTLSTACQTWVKAKVVGCDDEILANTDVMVEIEGARAFGVTNAQGEFLLPAQAGKTAKIGLYNGNFSRVYERNIDVQSGQTKDLGSLELCAATGGAYFIEFTLNGDGFTNRNVRIDFMPSEQNIEAWHNVVQENTTIYGYGWPQGFTYIDFGLTFLGNTAGNYVLNTGSSGQENMFLQFQITRNNVTDGYLPNSLNLTVNYYGPVNDIITGTFSGQIRHIDSAQRTITITNGRFTAPRTPNI